MTSQARPLRGFDCLTNAIALRPVSPADLPIFLAHQNDPVANHMAAFVARRPWNEISFSDYWRRVLVDDTIYVRTVLLDGEPVGNIMLFERCGRAEVCYRIAREYWGRGIAAIALAKFLQDLTRRPLYARAARDNVASVRVLEKCGFEVIGYERVFANARGAEIDEVILMLSEF